MKNKKGIIVVVLIIIFVVIGFITYNVVTDDNKLSASDKKWINSKINNVQNINVINDINIFGNTGAGVFYDFIKDLEVEYRLKLNPVTFNYGETPNGITLGVKTKLGDYDTVFYEDHYVLVGKKDEIVVSYDDFVNKKIGIINSDLSYVSNYLSSAKEIHLTGYENKSTLLEALKAGTDIDYVIVPLTLYLDEILKNDYFIVNHLSDVKFYYTISGKDNRLTKILSKFYSSWCIDNLDQYFKREEFKIFTSSLGITETEVDAMQSVTYNYGFVNNSPYEVIMSGNYGGIIALYLNEFSSLSNIDFNYKRYRNLNSFQTAINKKEVDLYFNYYNMQDAYYGVNSRILSKYSVVTNKDNPLVINSFNSLIGREVYVLENSKIHGYLNSFSDINIKTYNSEKELKKLNKKDDIIIVIDNNIFDVYKDNILSNYSSRFTGTIKDAYNFESRTDSAFYKIFAKYMMTLDYEEMTYKGIHAHSLTVKKGSLLGTIAKYILLTVIVFIVIFVICYKSSKKIKVAKKIKKENKMKFIDQLTSLKNRNYLNEYINNWNNNTIYPQTMIVIDLNNVQFINDTLGYEEGDKQIMAAANILIKTQLDNSDIMRTDGNEFLIYLVGYTPKQVTNYIHKLNKEFKKLPYEYGAEFGYSMINDSVKTIEDAIIEATDEMKKSKKKVDVARDA